MKFLNMLLVAMVVVFLVNMHSHEACRVLQGKEKLMMMKEDVLQIRDRGTTVTYNFPINLIIKQVLQKGSAPPGGSNPTNP
ncbi:hypothetical protein D8674_003243 [Pyrus ussuriensis x Pyrus communis]|uniref:Uncharacterized protein n=1 Tax=Pyrus ussuriensis x Pyrus communis TaxID=2448454 RepID=A0A5N5FGI5_9ROSA|nr:hypothetical protein D8674_003243 [Pyrus ussuriensis x Pyrus communis]